MFAESITNDRNFRPWDGATPIVPDSLDDSPLVPVQCDCARLFATSRAFLCRARSESEPSSRGTRLYFHTRLRRSGFEALCGVSRATYPGRLASQAI
jgi:hypothetical protein